MFFVINTVAHGLALYRLVWADVLSVVVKTWRPTATASRILSLTELLWSLWKKVRFCFYFLTPLFLSIITPPPFRAALDDSGLF